MADLSHEAQKQLVGCDSLMRTALLYTHVIRHCVYQLTHLYDNRDACDHDFLLERTDTALLMYKVPVAAGNFLTV